MSKRESIARFNLIVKKLRKRPASFAEISEFLSRESELQDYNFRIDIRTFQRDLNDIRCLYDIDIRYNRTIKAYAIESEGKNDAMERIMEAFDTFNALNISDRLSDYIHFENRRSSGTENLYGLLNAIKQQSRISFNYNKYWEENASMRTVEPYALKEFKNRWYLLGKDTNKNQLRIFALDRLNDLEIRKQKFQFPKDFSVNEYFRHSFGIIAPDEKAPEEVILSFDPDQGKYIKSLPLHHSQQILKDTVDELLIRLKLVITFDFIMELLSHGADVKVIQPPKLIERIISIYQKTLSQYSIK